MAQSRRPAQSPSSAVRPLEIRSIKAGYQTIVRFLGGYGGILTHYSKSSPIWCPGPGKCPPSNHKGKLIFKAYAPVEIWLADLKQWQPDVLEITERLEEVLRGRELRGQVWMLERQGKGHKTDPVFGTFCSVVPVNQLSPKFDTLPVVRRIYGAPDLEYGAVNMLPQKVMMSNVEGPAPEIPAELTPDGPRPLTAEEIEWANRSFERYHRKEGEPGMSERFRAFSNGRKPSTNGQS